MIDISTKDQTIIQFETLAEIISYLQAQDATSFLEAKLWRRKEQKNIDGLERVVEGIVLNLTIALPGENVTAVIDAQRAELLAQVAKLDAQKAVIEKAVIEKTVITDTVQTI